MTFQLALGLVGLPVLARRALSEGVILHGMRVWKTELSLKVMSFRGFTDTGVSAISGFFRNAI